MSVLRLRWQQRGGHIHCRVFVAPRPTQTFAKVGDLVFDEREWPAVREQLAKCIEIVDDEP